MYRVVHGSSESLDTLQVICTNWNVQIICRLAGWFEAGAADVCTFHNENEIFSFQTNCCSKEGTVVGVFLYCEVILLLCVFYVSEAPLVQCSEIQFSSL